MVGTLPRCPDNLSTVTLAEAMDINGVPGGAPHATSMRVAPAAFRRFWAGGVSAMTTPRTIWVSREAMAEIERGSARRLLVHELTHLRQWRRHGAAGFVARYLGDYLKARAGGFSHSDAYRAIRFERAAEAEARRWA